MDLVATMLADHLRAPLSGGVEGVLLRPSMVRRLTRLPGLGGLKRFDRTDRIVLVTKVGTTWDPVTKTTKIDGRYSTVKRMCEESLKRLQTDHVDLLLMHWPDADTPIADSEHVGPAMR